MTSEVDAYPVETERNESAKVDRSIPFVDTHHHLWELGRFRYDWLQGDAHDEHMGDYRAICVDWGPDRFFREFYGQNVIKSIHVEADYSGPDPVEETAWLEDVASAYGYPNGLVVMCQLDRVDAEKQLERHVRASSRVRGVRLREQPEDIEDSAFRAGYAALARLGLSYELNASPGRLHFGRALAATRDDVQVILGHAGFPIARDAGYFRKWRNDLMALADLEHVACKISGFAGVDHRWSVDSLRPWVLAAIEAFGVDRAMFGTNWPVDVLYAPYIEQVDAWRRILAAEGFSLEEQHKLLHANAERLYHV